MQYYPFVKLKPQAKTDFEFEANFKAECLSTFSLENKKKLKIICAENL